MNRKKLKNSMGEIGGDIVTAFVIVAVIMLSLYAYCGIWPPMVVIESGSMEHPPDPWTTKSYIGVIDTGDMVFVKKVNGSYGTDVVTYLQGQSNNYWRYGAYGDVIIYRPNGLEYRGDGTPVVPIIHRLVVWLQLNTSRVNPDFDGIDYVNYSFDVPSLEIYDTVEPIIINNYGYQHEKVTINLGWGTGLMRYYEGMGIVPHGGYITMGDNNAPAYDQPFSGSYEPVEPGWIIGKAWGELPWFGLIKLWATGSNTSRVAANSWNALIVTIVALLLIPLGMDFLIPRIKKRFGQKNDPDNEEKTPVLDDNPPEERLPPPDEDLPELDEDRQSQEDGVTSQNEGNKTQTVESLPLEEQIPPDEGHDSEPSTNVKN